MAENNMSRRYPPDITERKPQKQAVAPKGAADKSKGAKPAKGAAPKAAGKKAATKGRGKR